MEKFEYIVERHVKLGQRFWMSVEAQSKEKADNMIVELVEECPLSLNNGDSNIIIIDEGTICDTEELEKSTIKVPTLEVYDEDCESYETKKTIYTNLKKESVSTIKEEFRELEGMRENYNVKIRDLLFRLLKNERTPVVLADEEDDDDEEVDVVVACSGHSDPYNGKVLSVWLSGENICMKVQDIQGCDVSDIDECDLEEDGLFFIIKRIISSEEEFSQK